MEQSTKEMKKRFKGLLTLVLVFLMMFGNSLSVLATDAQQPISAATAFVKEVCDAIEKAPAGETVEIETDVYTCYTAKIMEKLSTRPDIALKTTFLTEDKTWKTFTIPAGQAPAEGELFYGFTYLGILYGWGECDHVHDEACGGEENCTHVHAKEEDCDHVHDEACGGEENCTHVHAEEEDCDHVHDEACGGEDDCIHVHNENC